MTPLSAANARVKEARKLSRRSVRTERRLFIADGPKAVEGALGVPGCVQEIFATEAGAETYASVLADQQVTLVDDRAMAGLSDSVTPAGVVALCRFLDVPLADIVGPLVVICADVRDPGNAGTVIRCADAAGASGVILAGDSVDLYNPKTIRASVGSVFHLPVAIERDPQAAVKAAKAAGLTVLAADMHGTADLFTADDLLVRPTAWLMGNEAWGLPAELAATADEIVSIPIFGKAESLNLSTAAALCLYASARAQRG
ncbi:TrmH family RNA methyltransferase [Nocardioides albus]|uniref:TrmH family RNA methyltransferase n=1 Tax=Nocardioides albus TaxID=1841 RepID=A0A7W5A9C0_9ACTN|nr:RNA methyltransferase [Nocardioides albus]MBB3091942.1 TrmH family RNA methyltransferase [Nocardioides albus]GGU32705.1 RNA methyltransferase [Nocardioides albus]